MSAPLFIDTDTASDDVVALMMAFAFRRQDIIGIGIVAGNCPTEQAAINALFTADICEAHVPVYLGEKAPLKRPLETAQHVHGTDGMGDIGLVPQSLSESSSKPATFHAADALISSAREHAGQLDLVTLGPLTNIAIALQKAPELAGQIRRCYVMGGASDNFGNITPVSEFNIWADPEAAEIVFASNMPITMIGWDISRKYAEIAPELSAELRAIGTRKAQVAIDCQKTLLEFCRDVTGVDGFDLPDPIAMAVALDEAVATESFEAAIHVSVEDGLVRGQTIIDDRSFTDRPRNVTIVTKADREKFVALLKDALK